ncbi:acyl-ACP thioesterase domain-containing protein [Nocardia sp. NPDC058176]|uniref:acyl-ACP thioesterase domain-containing protein n=1 Tax=Nocardia sp. NPDC058176 TaxID=3346368 RepID=UPI0036DCA5FB
MPDNMPAPELESGPDGAEPFTATYRVRGDDIDQTMRVRLDAVARYVQDISADMIEDSPFFETDPYWILRRTIIDVRAPMSWPGNVSVNRWCSATASRWVAMRQTLRGAPESSPFNPATRSPGLVETESFCIKVNADGFPSRISDQALDHLSRGVSDTRLRWRALNDAPTPAESGADTVFAPRASDVDQFAHVNNVIHWQIVESALTSRPDLLAHPYRGILEYLRPVPPDTPITVRRCDERDRLLLWMLIDQETVAATASVTRR